MNGLDNSSVPPETKRRGRKPKKMAQKELMNMFYEETGGNAEQKETGYNKKTLECYKYLSPAEKQGFDKSFTQAKNANQAKYVALLEDKTKKIIVVSGPAGTGKTLFATEYGIRNFLLGIYDKIIFTRPSVSVDEDIGYLPGSLEEKMAPWVRPIYDILYQFITPKDVKQHMEDKTIEIAPLGYMRGRTFKNAWIVADEMQNSTISQMKMLMTRLGENSRIVITGDLEQYDRQNEVNGLEDFLKKFKERMSSSIASFQFEKNDIQREEVVKEVLGIYSGEEI
jgi:phosphate starvation-inducible PhoH-like protein